MTMIPKRTRDTDVAAEVAQGKLLRQRIIKCADEAAERFMKGADLNDVVAEIGGRENFNRLQLQRLIEETNTVAYNKKYETMRQEKDRRISFPLAELDEVLQRMGATAPPEVDNPNLVTGKVGDGEMNKAASAAPAYLHSPNGKLEQKREQLLEKRASFDKVELERAVKSAERAERSAIFKIANSLVMTERLHKAANQTFNTLLDEVPLATPLVEAIQKQASDLAATLVNTRRARPGFAVELALAPTEKIAHRVLGEHSLLKTAAADTKVAPPKVAPTGDVATYQQLVELAKQLQLQAQHTQQHSSEV